MRTRRHPRRRHGRRVGAERVLGPIPAVAVQVPHLRRGLVPRAGEGPAGGGGGRGGGEGDAPAEAGRRPAPRVGPAADEAAAGLAATTAAAATGPEAVVVIVADFAVFQLPFLLRGKPARIQHRRRRRRRLRRRSSSGSRRLRGRHGAQDRTVSGQGRARPCPSAARAASFPAQGGPAPRLAPSPLPARPPASALPRPGPSGTLARSARGILGSVVPNSGRGRVREGGGGKPVAQPIAGRWRGAGANGGSSRHVGKGGEWEGPPSC